MSGDLGFSVPSNTPATQHKSLLSWLASTAELCQPKDIHWCDGSAAEAQRLLAQMTDEGACVKLNEKLRPNSYLFRSNPKDVARVESRTFICSDTPDGAGPTNNWRAPAEMHAELKNLFKGCMQGRTLYVIPFCMGPLGSSFSRIGVEISDSPYVVVNMRIMARVGPEVLEMLGDDGFFVPCLHSVGQPLAQGTNDVPWPCNPEQTCIAHFPQERKIFSFGSGYGGNALLGKKCMALRIASSIGHDEGWLAEHMLVLGIESPKRPKRYIAAAFPSACGKTNFAMMVPPKGLEDYKITCVGDDIAWLKESSDGRIRAVNPEMGFFGVAPGTSMETNPQALASCSKNAIFTNVALTPEGDIWWEGLTKEPPAQLSDWKGENWTPECGRTAAHPNGRFTAPIHQCPVTDAAVDSPDGVPIEAIIFGGRRSADIPLVFETFSWAHGVYAGATMVSERTAAAEGAVGDLREDPMAMLPFCGYHMGDYFQHWLKVGAKLKNAPRIFHVNWFRKDKQGNFLWPGFGQNVRVLDWILRRVEGQLEARKSALGYLPSFETFNWDGLAYEASDWEALMELQATPLMAQLEHQNAFLETLGDKLPEALKAEHAALLTRLRESD